MNDHDQMIAHMIHMQQKNASIQINSILLRHADKLSPEFLIEATTLNDAWLRDISKFDDQLMKEFIPIVSIANAASEVRAENA